MLFEIKTCSLLKGCTQFKLSKKKVLKEDLNIAFFSILNLIFHQKPHYLSRCILCYIDKKNWIKGGMGPSDLRLLLYTSSLGRKYQCLFSKTDFRLRALWHILYGNKKRVRFGLDMVRWMLGFDPCFIDQGSCSPYSGWCLSTPWQQSPSIDGSSFISRWMFL